MCSTKFCNDTNNNILYLEHDGNVGIGHNNPTTKLQVNGAISSSGAISAGPAAGGNGIVATNGIVWRLFTGFLGGDPSTTTIAHGVTNGKKRIVGVNVNVQTTETEGSTAPDNSFIASQGVTNDGGDEGFYVYYDNTNVYIVLDSDSDALDDSRYTAIVMYTQQDLYS